jgi:hypothetical protein
MQSNINGAASAPKGPTNPRYKTILCKHFDTPQGCSYGDKCQFAHGTAELRLNNNAQMFTPQMAGNQNKVQNAALNFKIVKCKNFEKDGSCKYGNHCTFAHGDKDLRNKADNLYQMNQMFMFPMMCGMDTIPVMMPPNMDFSQMNAQGMNPGQFMMMNNPMMNPFPEGMNINGNNVENKEGNQ